MTNRCRSWPKLLLALLPWAMTACGGTEPAPVGIDPEYPTTLLPISSDSLSILSAQFQSSNPRLCSGLSAYGYTKGMCESGSVGFPAHPDLAAMVKTVKLELVRNGRFTGVRDTSELILDKVLSTLTAYRFDFDRQRAGTIEILGSEIYVFADSVGVLAIHGNHFPSVYVPSQPRVSSRAAQESILGLDITWFDVGGNPRVFTVSWKDLDLPPFQVVLPHLVGENLELRLAWSVPMRSGLWMIYVDTMTGEQLGILQRFVT
jgi:hypothetical protein